MAFTQPRANRPATRLPAAVLLTVGVLLFASLAAPLGTAQTGGGGGGSEPPATSPPPPEPAPDLVIAALQGMADDGVPCCPPPPAPEPCCEDAPEPEPCCEETPEPAPHDEPCCEAPEPEHEPCCEEPPRMMHPASFVVVLANHGDAPAHDVGAELRVAGIWSFTLEPVPVLMPHEEVRIQFSLEAPSGWHEVRAVVDPADLIVESDEDNNVAAMEAYFGPAPRPDLVIRPLHLVPQGGGLHAEVDVANHGGDAGPFSLLVLRDGHVLDILRVAGLGGGETLRHGFAVRETGSDMVLTVVVDAADEVAESYEWNNHATATYAAPRADLLVTGLNAPDVPLAEGADGPTGTVLFTIENRGTGTASPTGYVVLVDGSEAHRGEIGLLGPGESMPVDVQVPAAAGHHLIEVDVDSDERIEETSESNNRRAAIAFFGHPDLAVEVRLADVRGAAYGDTTDATVVVTNDGPFPAAATQVEVRDGARHLVTLDVPALASGAAVELQAPWTLGPGVHTISAAADPTDVLREGDEANNHAAEALDLGRPDLEVTRLGWDLETPEEGRPLHIETGLRYNGLLSLPAASARLSIDGAVFATWALDALAPGATFDAVTEWQPTEGTYALGYTLDPRDVWPESNETNNAAVEDVHVRAPTPAACTTAPDVQEQCRRVLLGEEDPLMLDG